MPPAGTGSPGSAISSPVARMATTRPPLHAQPGMVGRRGQADIARAQAPARGQQRVAPAKSWPCAADVLARGRAASRRMIVSPSRADILLQHDAIRAAGMTLPVNRRTASPRVSGAVERPAGGRRAHHLQLAPRDAIGGPQRVAVHGRHVGRRLRQAREHVLRQHAVPRLREGHVSVPVRGRAARMRRGLLLR